MDQKNQIEQYLPFEVVQQELRLEYDFKMNTTNHIEIVYKLS